MQSVETILALLGLTTLLAFGAHKAKVPYPIFLVIGGMAVAFVPSLPSVSLDPQLVFLFFLPPILYAAGYFTSWRDFRANLVSITLLAVGLVVATTLAVAFVVVTLVPGVPWSAALVLGAIVSPPDAVAATAIARRVRLPRQIVTILEGESLVNDATGLVLLKFASAAIVTGHFAVLPGAANLPAWSSAASRSVLPSVGSSPRRSGFSTTRSSRRRRRSSSPSWCTSWPSTSTSRASSPP